MYIKYKSLSNGKISIINVDVSNCETITTEDSKLVITMLDSLKKKNVSLSFNSEEDAIKALENLFDTLYNKAPLGNMLDLTNLDEVIKIDETNMNTSTEQGGEE